MTESHPIAFVGLRLGLDVGGTNIRLGVFDGLTLIQETRFQANYSQLCQQHPPALAWQHILHSTHAAIAPLLTRYAAIQSIGIGFPGFIDPQSGILAQSPNLPGLHQVNLGLDLSQLVGRSVSVFNDANAAAYGEYALLGQPATGLLYVGLGTGVGGGLVVNGQVWTGSHGYALEVGHLNVVYGGALCGCGNRGCLEQYASATAISQRYQALTGQVLSAQAIAAQAAAGELIAQQVFAEAGERLGQALAMVLNIVDVAHVVIGGGVAAAWTWFAPSAHQRLQQDLIPVLKQRVQIHVSTVGDTAGMLGAALLA